MQFNLKVAGLAELLEKFGNPQVVRKPLRTFLTDAAIVVQGHAQRNVRVATGKTRKRIKYSINTRQATARVYLRKLSGRQLQVPIWLEKGTKPHEIGPAAQATTGRTARRNKRLSKNGITVTQANRALKIKGLGGGYFARVHHPGTRAYPFMEPALGQSQGEINRLERKLEADIIRELGG